MRKTIFTQNGLEIDALFLDALSDGTNTSYVYYAQGRIVECDKDGREIVSHDLLTMICKMPVK